MTGSMARNSGATLAAKLFALGAGFVYAVAAARLLGPTGYGIVAVAISVATLVATISLAGMDGLAVRETARLIAHEDCAQLRAFVRWSCLATLWSSVTLGAVMFAVSFIGAGPYRTGFLIGSFAVPLLAGLNLLRAITQGAGEIVAAQMPMEVVRWLLTLGLIGAMLALRESPTPARLLLIILISFALSLAAAIAFLLRFLMRAPTAGRTAARPREWLKEAAPFLSIALFGIVGTEILTILVGWMAGPREAGLYQPIAKLAPVIMIANQAIEVPLAPRIVSLWHKSDRFALERVIRRSATASTLATGGIAAAILLASPYIFAAFGREFTQYRTYLYAVAAAQLLNAATGPSALVLAMVGDMKRRVQAQAATLAVQAGLGILLIPTLGAAGAAIALTGAITAWALIHWILAWRAIGIDTSILSLLGQRSSRDA